MNETTKAMRRRNADMSFPWNQIFQGALLDVGSGDDPLDLPNCIHLDLPDRGGDNLGKFYPAETFHCIHGSQVLEHMLDPVVALKSWIKCLRPGGYIVATVPDFELYEHCIFPSKFNDGHCSTWSLTIPNPIPKQILLTPKGHIHCKLPEWLDQFQAKVLRCVLIDSNYDYSIRPPIDQTFDASKNVEAFLEMVLQKPFRFDTQCGR